jgi:hypothetical protein
VERVVGQMMFAVHVQKRARPDFFAFEGFEETANPKRFDEKKIHALFGAAALDAMDEKTVRIELMRHD